MASKFRRVFSEVEPKSRGAWRDWLRKNHTQPESVWVVIYKKTSGRVNFTVSDVVEEALCFGWIDSVPNKIDEFKFKLLLSPRRARSVWSALNKRRVKKLIAEGLMTESGLQKIRLAKKTGTWNQLRSSDRLEVPRPLDLALKRNKKAAAFFRSLPPSYKRSLLEWINSAKTKETQQRRVAETLRLCAKGLRRGAG